MSDDMVEVDAAGMAVRVPARSLWANRYVDVMAAFGSPLSFERNMRKLSASLHRPRVLRDLRVGLRPGEGLLDRIWREHIERESS